MRASMICLCRWAVLCVLLGATDAHSQPAAVDTALAVSPLAFETTTLPNGLQVVVHEDHSARVAAVQVWYHVGSKDGGIAASGHAHLLEHLMFQGSKNVPAGRHVSMLAAVGGESNAFTTEDTTVFWNTIPSTHVRIALWLEADRMASLRFDDRSFLQERDVILAERKTLVDDPPYGRLSEIVRQGVFTAHPYMNLPTGSEPHLRGATRQTVQDFFRTYFVPNNAVVVVAGDVDARQVFEWATAAFGRVPRRGREIPRVTVTQPTLDAPLNLTRGEHWPLPVAVAAHLAPPAFHADAAPLRILLAALGTGEGSRLSRALVYDRRLAMSATAGASWLEQPGLLYAHAIVQPGHTIEEASAVLDAELLRITREPLMARELDRAKRQVIREVVVGRTSVYGKAAELGRAAVTAGQVEAANTLVTQLQHVTADDVLRAARQYLDPQRRVSIMMTRLPAPEEVR